MINKHVKFEAKIPYGSKETKFQLGQFKSLKQIFCKFEGQFDLEGQGHKFLK